MSQQFRALSALTEDQGSITSTHTADHSYQAGFYLIPSDIHASKTPMPVKLKEKKNKQ